MIILHFALKNKWIEETREGLYGASCIVKNGYIPCFTVSDIFTANINFPTLEDYIILCIDENRVSSEIKYEKFGDSDFISPNIYGEISKDSVIHILPYTFDNKDKFVVTNEVLDFNIINDACKNLNINYESHKYFNDGTQSRIILLNDSYIIKQSNTKQLEAETTFATFYKDIPMLQKMAYFDKDYKYIVYNFVPGDVMHTVENFFDVSNNIKNIVSHYKPYTKEGYGFIDTPFNSWADFLRDEVNDASLLLPELNYLLPVVNDAISELEKLTFEKKLIHGDFGTHNFIKQNEKFVAAIDPTPILGDPTYDLLFALVSNIDLIPYLSIDFLTEYTGESRNKVTALLKIVLYCRICRCAKYNKDWIEPYMNFGNNLFN